MHIPAEVLSNVFLLRAGAKTGTAFGIQSEGRDYLVTARHVVDTSDAWKLSQDGAWRPIQADKPVHHPHADISIVRLDEQLSNLAPCTANGAGLTLGEDLNFLGFPFGQTGKHEGMNGGFPVAFVRRATLSAFPPAPPLAHELWLDGHCNEGFSGGPVIFKNAWTGVVQIAGVVSGFRTIPSPVEFGQNEMPWSVATSAGLVLAHPISAALELTRL